MIPGNFNNINALVIDNNGSMRQIMVSMLRAMGMEKVIVANNESQLLPQVISEGINLVVCGWEMPKLNALTVLEKLRKNDSTIKIPFVIVSTIIEQTKIKQAIELGVSEYLVPPFNKKIFENRVSQALKLPIQPSAVEISRAINSKRFIKKEHIHDLNVLIVDDIADNISVIKGIIQDEYKVRAVLNAKSAMKLCISDFPPDIVLLDIMMPEVNGLTLCKELKKNPLTQNIVVIFLTALTETQDVVKGLSLGAVDYITKPIIPEILLARIAVHSKIILNQRTIQAQIDSLLKQSKHFNEYNIDLYRKINTLLADCSEELDTAANSTLPKKAQILGIKHDVDMSNILLSQFNVLIKLQQNSYHPKKTRLNINAQLLRIISSFENTPDHKSINLITTIDEYEDIFCDELLLNVLFSSLYIYTLEVAERNSKVSITMDIYPKFVLIKFQNMSELADGIIPVRPDNNGQIPEFSSDINIHLAFLASLQLNNELYYHSSAEHGTIFYLKLAK